MAKYDVKVFATYSDFEAYLETLDTTTEVKVVYSPDIGYIAVVG